MLGSDHGVTQEQLALPPEQPCHHISHGFVQDHLDFHTVKQCQERCHNHTGVGVVHQTHSQQQLQGQHALVDQWSHVHLVQVLVDLVTSGSQFSLHPDVESVKDLFPRHALKFDGLLGRVGFRVIA